MGHVTLGPFQNGTKLPRDGKQYCIEGDYVSMREIAERLGVTHGAVMTRMTILKKQPGAITWDKLKKAGGK